MAYYGTQLDMAFESKEPQSPLDKVIEAALNTHNPKLDKLIKEADFPSLYNRKPCPKCGSLI